MDDLTEVLDALARLEDQLQRYRVHKSATDDPVARRHSYKRIFDRAIQALSRIPPAPDVIFAKRTLSLDNETFTDCHDFIEALRGELIAKNDRVI